LTWVNWYGKIESMKTAEEQGELFGLPLSDVKPRSEFALWIEAFTKHGWLLTPSLVASFLGVSKQRVHQLLTEDRIASIRVCGHRMVPITAVELYKLEDKSLGGRPPKIPRWREMVGEAKKVVRK
jgi:hypothetical protein